MIILLMNLALIQNLSAQQQCELGPVSTEHEVKNIPTEVLPPSGPVSPPVDPPPDERVVGFVHGINGGSNTWVTARNWTEEKYERAITPTDLRYNMDNLADASARIQEQMDAANDLHNANTDEEYDEENSFIVAHSLGGLVARDVEYRTIENDQSDWQQQFGGLITFGTPHQGTELVNNLDLAAEVANKGCHLILNQEITEFIEQNFSELGLASSFVKNTLYSITLESDDMFANQGVTVENIVCDNILAAGLNAVLESMLPQIAQDMSPDSESLTKLNSHEFSYPLVACYGVEDDPVSLRQIVATQNNIDALPFGSADLVSEEQEIIRVYDNYVKGLEAEYDYYSNLEPPGSSIMGLIANIALDILKYGAVGVGAGYLTAWIFMPGASELFSIIGGSLGSLYGLIYGAITNSNSPPDTQSIASAYLGLWYWALNFDDNYRLVMGIDNLIPELYGYHTELECQNEGFENGIDCTDVENQFINIECDCQEVEVPVYHLVNERFESDGTVRANSASQVPHSNVFKTFEMMGSNHVQMKNDSKTDLILRTLYEGTGEIAYFKLEL